MASRNPRPFAQLDHESLARTMLRLGCDQAILILTKTGDPQAQQLITAGSNPMDAAVASEQGHFCVEGINGYAMTESAAELNRLAQQAAKEMQEGTAEDANLGEKLTRLDLTPAQRGRKKLS